MDSSPEPTTTIYRASPGTGVHVWSPFVIKLETRLRLAGIKYTTAAGSIKDAPRGKFPYITLSRGAGAAPLSLADSTLIIKRLTADGTLADINASLSPEGRARDLALRALFEDKLYFYSVRRPRLPDRDRASHCGTGLRALAPQLLRHALARARLAAVPGAGRRRALHLPARDVHAARAGHGAVLRGRGCGVPAGGLGGG